MSDWRPTADLAALEKRAELLAAIRGYFNGNALEADVPCLGRDGVTDLNIDNIRAQVNGATAYLQSSPEYFLKRLLAAGSEDIYYLGKAFRGGESSNRHNPEFTLLEWYRLGWDEQQLMSEVADLLSRLVRPNQPAVHRIHYGDIFFQVTGLNPHIVELDQLQEYAGELARRSFGGETRTTCLDLIFSLAVEPALPAGLCLVDHYPACQSALAKLGEDAGGNPVALRFEAFLDGMELANGYCELTDPAELRRRFTQDITERQDQGRSAMGLDENFMAAMEHGLPDCAGVALGVDRLLMYLLGAHAINDGCAFPLN